MPEKETLLKTGEYADDRYNFFNPIKTIKIFGFELDSSDCEILISKNLSWTEIVPVLTGYFEWLSSCKTEVTSYFCSKLGEDLPENWFESIEVYSASIVFNTLEDFGATIEFGESVLSDHIVTFDIEKFKIIADWLNG